MVRIAITGGIACGKSLVGKMFSDAGIAVCDTDELAHSLLVPGSAVYDRIIDEFGYEILDENGNINRGILGRIVFNDKKRLHILNEIMHPEIKKMFEGWLRSHETDWAAAVLIPLLYESGMDSGWDYIVCVACSEDVQIKRLCERGLSVEDARLRIAAQMPVEEKMARADFVIYNDGTVSILKQEVEKIIQHILEK